MFDFVKRASDKMRRAIGAAATADEAVVVPTEAAEQPQSILSEFHELKQQTVAVARDTVSLVERSGSRHRDAVAELADRLDSQTVNIVFVGIWSSGKSSLINAVLGEKRLPMDINVESAAIARILRGDGRSMVVSFTDGRQDESLTQSPENVREFMSAKSSRRVESDVKEVALTSTNRLCADGAVLVDTPGVEDLNQLRADVTYRFVPQADFVVFLMNAAQAGQLSELSFLQKIVAQGVKDVCFVVNMVDGKDPADVERVLEALRRKVEPIIDSPQIFGVSALYALQAKFSRVTGESLASARKRIPALRTSAADSWDELLAESGLSQVEAFLADKCAASTRSGQFLRMGLQRLDLYLAEELARLAMALQGLFATREEMASNRAELERLQTKRVVYFERVAKNSAEFEQDGFAAIDEFLGAKNEGALQQELHVIIQSMSPDAWQSGVGPRIEIALFGHLNAFSVSIRNRMRAVESELQAGLRESFEDMARIAEIEVNTSPSIKATGIEPIHLNYGGTDMERQAKAASWAGMGAAALGGIAGIITLASVPIAGPVFPLVAAAIGALIGLGEGVQKVSQQQRDAACAAAELQVKRLFDGARLQCRDMVRESRGQIAERYMNSLKERHTALVAECDAALQSTHRDLHETESLAAIRKREIEEVRSIQGRVARLLQQIGARSGEPQ